MGNILLVILCFILGIIFRKHSETGNRTFYFPIETPKVLNNFIIFISLPALILLHIHELKFNHSLIALIIMPWIIFITSTILFSILGKFLNWDSLTIGGLILTSGLGNTSFVGLPMIEAYYGKEFISYGLLADQGGTFFMLSTLGIMVAIKFSSHSSYHTSDKKNSNIFNNNLIFIKDTFIKILKFPPFFIFIITFLLKPFNYPDWFKHILNILGNTLTPLALFSVGFQLKLSELKHNKKYIFIGLFYKLILSPLMIAFLYYFLNLEKNVYYISIFEAAMGPMITGGIIAISYNLNPPLVSLMLAIGISLSFITLPIFWYLFH